MKRIIAFLISFCLIFEQAGLAQVAVPLGIPGYINGLSSPEKFRPIHLRYLSYDYLKNNFRILLDKGDKKKVKENDLKISARGLFKYFLIGLTLPNESFWVNLRPDSPDNVIDPDLARTDIGRVFLEADVQLKKDTARYTSPDTVEGKQYWSRLYQKADELFASEKINIPTLTRPWIVPNEIILRESGANAYIYKASLKVMLESDYLKNSATYSFQDERLKILNEYSAGLIRELIIPKLNKDVNTAKKYASLRQVYYSLILAQWFKKQFKNDMGSGIGIDQKDLTGLVSTESWSKDTYFRQYQGSFQKGEYKTQQYCQTFHGQTIRQYFSGGINLGQPGRNPAVYKGVFDQSALPNTVEFEADRSIDGFDLILPSGQGKKVVAKKEPAVLLKDGGLIDSVRADAPGREMVRVNINDPGCLLVIAQAVRQDKVIVLDLDGSPHRNNRDYFLLKQKIQALASAVSPNNSRNQAAAFAFYEGLKNAFVHGNKLDFNLPIVFYVEPGPENSGAIYLYDNNLERPVDEMESRKAQYGGLSGSGRGLTLIEQKYDIQVFPLKNGKKVQLSLKNNPKGMFSAIHKWEPAKGNSYSDSQRDGGFKSVNSFTEVMAILEKRESFEKAAFYFDIDNTVFDHILDPDNSIFYPTADFVPIRYAMIKGSGNTAKSGGSREEILSEIAKESVYWEKRWQETGMLARVDQITELMDFLKRKGVEVFLVTNRSGDQGMINRTVDILNTLDIKKGRDYSDIHFVGVDNGKARIIQDDIAAYRRNKIYFADNNKDVARDIAEKLTGIDLISFHLDRGKQEGRLSYEYFIDRLNRLPLDKLVTVQDRAKAELFLTCAELEITRLAAEKQVDKINDFINFMKKNSLDRSEAINVRYINQYLQDITDNNGWVQRDGGNLVVKGAPELEQIIKGNYYRNPEISGESRIYLRNVVTGKEFELRRAAPGSDSFWVWMDNIKLESSFRFDQDHGSISVYTMGLPDEYTAQGIGLTVLQYLSKLAKMKGKDLVLHNVFSYAVARMCYGHISENTQYRINRTEWKTFKEIDWLEKNGPVVIGIDGKYSLEYWKTGGPEGFVYKPSERQDLEIRDREDELGKTISVRLDNGRVLAGWGASDGRVPLAYQVFLCKKIPEIRIKNKDITPVGINADGGRIISFSRYELEKYIASEMDEPSSAGIKKTYENLYPDTSIYLNKAVEVPVASVVPSKQSRIVLKELAARIMELREGAKKNMVIWKDTDINGKIRNFIIDGHHRFAAADVINRSAEDVNERINTLPAEIFEPLQRGRTAFSRIQPRSISEINVVLPQGGEVRLEDVSLKAVSEKDGVVFEINDGGNLQGERKDARDVAGDKEFNYQKAVEGSLLRFMTAKDPSSVDGKARVFTFVFTPGFCGLSNKEKKEVFIDKVNEFVDYLPVDINRKIVRSGSGIEAIIYELCKNAFDGIMSLASLPQPLSLENRLIDVYFGVRAGVKGEKYMEISVENNGAGKHATSPADKGLYVTKGIYEKSPYIGWNENWIKFSAELIGKVNGYAQNGILASQKESSADIPGEKSAVVFELPVESLVLTGLKPVNDMGGKGDGGIATFEGRLAAQVEGILTERPDIVAGTIKKIFGRKLPRGAHYKVEYLASGAYKKVYKVSVFLDQSESLEFVLKAMDSVGRAELMRGYDEIDPEGKKFFIAPVNSSYAAKQGIRARVNDIDVSTEELLTPIRPEKLDRQALAAAVAGLVKAYFLSVGLSQWPDEQQDALFPVDISFENAGFTRAAKPAVKVLDMDLARRYTPLKILEACSFVMAGIETKGTAISVLQGIREAMDAPSTSAFFKQAAGELKKLFDNGAVEFRKENLGIQRKSAGYYAFTDYSHLDYDIYDELAKFAQLPSYGGRIQDKQVGGEDKRSISIPYDDEIEQAREHLAAKGYSEAQIAGWLARGRAKLLEIAEAAGFRPPPGYEKQLRRDGKARIINLFARELSVSNYLDDIQQAQERGEILTYSRQEDKFSLLVAGLTGGNTRSLSEEAKVLFNGRDQGGMDVLVLGPGAGKECADIYNIVKSAHIETVSLSPISPRLILKGSSLGIRRMLQDYIRKAVIRSNELGEEEVNRIKGLYAAAGIPLETVFELQNAGYRIFDQPDEPFIKRQYIGEFNNIDFKKKYDFIYEQIGGFWYSVKEDGIQKTVDNISRLLKADGLFYAENLPEPLDFSSLDIPDGFIGISSEDKDMFLIADKDSWFANVVSGDLIAAPREGEVYKIADPDRIFQLWKSAHPGSDGGDLSPLSAVSKDIVKIDLNDKDHIISLLEAVKSGKAVVLDLTKCPRADIKAYNQVRIKFERIALNIALRSNPGYHRDNDDFVLPIKEGLKNAFVHGNKLDFDLPIVLYVDLDRLKNIKTVEIRDNAAQKVMDAERKAMAEAASLFGFKLGLNRIKARFDYQYIQSEEGLKVSISRKKEIRQPRNIMIDGGSADDLRGILLRDLGSPGIIRVNLWDKLSWVNVSSVLKEGYVVEINLLGHPGTGKDSYRQVRDNLNGLADSIYEGLADEDKYFRDADIALTEMFKNAFLHGNRLDYRLPIFIRIKTEDNTGAKSFEIYDTASDKELTIADRQNATETELGGAGQAIKLLKWAWEYKRESLTGVKGAKVALSRINDKSAEGFNKDGGNKGGIDLRSLPIASQPNSFLMAGVNSKFSDMDMEGEWKQIQNMVNSGFIPNMERIRNYTAACCQKGVISRQKENILICVADILRIEEDKNLDTDPGIKELLASIDQLS
ncbi:MAG: hypothetical protein WC354_04940 [Candidatus Omnitrophota bacterium]|jgi:anti-sigma regulatory factor (Ser/Thr protein kinase)